MQFPSGQALFCCSTQLVPYQRMQILGTAGRIEIEIPFNAPPDRPCRIFVDDGSGLGDASARIETFDVVDQYTMQGDLFARAIREGTPLAFPLEDAVANMRVTGRRVPRRQERPLGRSVGATGLRTRHAIRPYGLRSARQHLLPSVLPQARNRPAPRNVGHLRYLDPRAKRLFWWSPKPDPKRSPSS